MNKAIFLDRDGTINIDYGYVYQIDKFKLIPKTLNALRLLSKNYQLIIITNQSGIGRNYFSLENYKRLEAYMNNLFQNAQINISKVYMCPHKPEDNCDCRKPNIKFIKQAEKELNIDLKNSFVIGDKTTDIKMGKNAGCKTILVETGKAGKDKNYEVSPNFIVKDLYQASRTIMGLN